MRGDLTYLAPWLPFAMFALMLAWQPLAYALWILRRASSPGRRRGKQTPEVGSSSAPN